MSKRWFLTVDWCGKDKRGIFCSCDGHCFSKETQHTEAEIYDILGAFEIILLPQSVELSEDEVKEHKQFIPLAEYSYQYGVAIIPTKLNCGVKL